jgi:4-amino-4-deoxy-L-arabinose transferase-like glycosyltransferase
LEICGGVTKSGKIITIIIAVAVVLRVAAAIWHPMVDRAVYPDAGDYHDLAKAIVRGEEYRCSGGIATRMPGYPIVVAGVYAIAGAKPAAVLIVQALMGGGICWMIWRMLRKTSERAAIIAAGIFALDPLSVAMSAALLSETAFTLALVAMTWTAMKIDPLEKTFRWCALFGALSAAAVYLRGSALYLPLWMILLASLRKMSGPGNITATWRMLAAAAMVAGILFVSLWPWYGFMNRHPELEKLRGLTTLEGISLYEAVYAGANGGPRQGDLLRDEPAEIRLMREGDRDALYKEKAWQEIREHPGRVAALAPVKFGRFWSPGLNETGLANPLVNVVLWCWQVPLFLLAIVGLWRGAMRGVPLLVLMGPIIYFTLLHMIFIGSVRYRVPLQPLICMLAAMGIVFALERFGKPKQTNR